MNAEPESDFDLKVPNLNQWWLVRPDIPIVAISREELEVRQAEMAPWVFERLDSLKEHERNIIAWVKQPDCGAENKRHLLSALEYLRQAISNYLGIVEDWGLVRPPAK